MELGLIKKVNIDQEMQQSYLDYAMSVIVSRALPDARDGLKPVQRRILYAMYDMGIRADSTYKKSARIVGEVLGKYHPHGDMAVYDAMARQAQDFSLRYMLVDGQGNFGSVDGDPPAAMRYTEARLAPIAMEVLNQIDKNTVDFSPNFDGTLNEPVVLPSAIPNMLVNGATGIAVGMATSIPPHNLGEVVDALIMMLQNWEKLDEISVQDIMRFIQGPDFPTGGLILQDSLGSDLSSAYGSGRGRVTMQARAHLEDMGRGRTRIIVTELPYMTNKAGLIERIADLVRDGVMDGIADLRDESDRHGMRIVIELTKTAEPEKVLRDLYHRTPMQSTFSINMLALVGGEPHLLSLKQALRVYLDHRQEVIRRRSEYDLEHARARAHILEGLRIALQNLDEVIAIIRASADVDTARKKLIAHFKLSEIQAQAILEMPLRRLAALERKKIETEYKEVMALIKDLEGLLKSAKRIRQVAADELLLVKQTYSDRRRTQIATLKEGEVAASMLTTTDAVPAQTVWIGVTADGELTRTVDDNPPRQSGREAPVWLLRTSTHHTLYMVTRQGRAAAVAVHAIPETEKTGGTVLVHKVAPLPEGEKLAAVFSLPGKMDAKDESFLLTATRGGMLKKTALGELPGPSSQSFQMVKINEGDDLGWVRVTAGKAEILMVTAGGMSIRFSEEEIRPMGLVAAGVAGIKLAVGDEIIGVELMPKAGEVFLIAADGKAKRIPLADFPVQGRYGLGTTAWKLPVGVRLVGVMVGKPTLRGVAHLLKAASRFVRMDEAPQRMRATQGAPTVEVKAGDQVTRLVVPWDAEVIFTPEKPTPESAPAAKKKKVPAV
jgi:DNA gyrase subunit A